MKKILVVVSGLVVACTLNLSVSASAQENNDTNKVVATVKKQAVWNKDFSKYEGMAKEAKDLANAGKMAECFDKLRELHKNAWPKGARDLMNANHKAWALIHWQIANATIQAVHHYQKETIAELDTLLSYFAEVANARAAKNATVDLKSDLQIHEAVQK